MTTPQKQKKAVDLPVELISAVEKLAGAPIRWSGFLHQLVKDEVARRSAAPPTGVTQN